MAFLVPALPSVRPSSQSVTSVCRARAIPLRASSFLRTLPVAVRRRPSPATVTASAATGDAVPAFDSVQSIAPSGVAKDIKPADLSTGTVALVFFPRAMTSGCTLVNKELTAKLADIDAMGARLLGVSPDDVGLQSEFIKKESLGFPLIADVDGEVISAFQVWKDHPTFGQVVNRSTIILKDGKIVKELRGVSSGGHADDVFAALKEVTAV